MGMLFRRSATTKMWTFYLKSLLLLLTSPESSHLKKDVVTSLRSAFSDAFEKDCLSAEMFNEWVLLYKALIHGSGRRRESLQKVLEDILIRVTSKWREVPSVWPISLTVKIELLGSEGPDEIHRFFQRGLDRQSAFVNSHDHVSEVDESSIREYVNLYVDWSFGKIAPKTILSVLDSCCSGKVFSLASACGRSLTAFFQTLILNVAHRIESIDSAYRLYRKYKDRQPINPAIFKIMLDLSKQHPDHGITAEIYEDYLSEFGKEDHHIWLDYIKYTIEQEEMTAIAAIHDRATRMLNPGEQTHFLAAYSLLMASL